MLLPAAATPVAGSPAPEVAASTACAQSVEAESDTLALLPVPDLSSCATQQAAAPGPGPGKLPLSRAACSSAKPAAPTRPIVHRSLAPTVRAAADGANATSAWGSDSYGQLGIGGDTTMSSVPLRAG